jgi:hypothetical protein
MAHKEMIENKLSFGQRVRKPAAKVLLTVGLGLGVAGFSGCGGGSSSETTTTAPITATTTTSEAGAGLGDPGLITATTASVLELTTTTGKAVEVVSGIDAAAKNADGWSLKNPDGQEVSISLPEGFTPDKDLVIQNDLQMNEINPDLSVYQDWDKVIHEVAGYNYDENDFSGNVDYLENVQGDMWAWRVFQGEEVNVPGIGHLIGDERTSVVVLVLNLQPNVIPWDKDGLGPVFNKHGFTATGRLWDVGNPEKIAEAEELLGGHWLGRQRDGTPEKSYIGVTDDPDNAKRTLYVSVANRQWGNNEDGTPREQFQLLNAQLVDFGK